VEDDAALADVYSIKLQLDGHVVRVVADAATAMAAFEAERPDVVCVDVMLPDRPGGELAERLAGSGSHVILFTNDELGVANPPRGVAMALLKVRTPPSRLSLAIAGLLAGQT
jgi:DNA-binding response OmpR family regulator